MKRVFGMVEVVFDTCYLAAAVVMGCVLLFIKEPSCFHSLGGAMALVLAGGDAFHLLPRIETVLTGQEEKMRVKLGRGKQITSITMTIFYLLLWEMSERLFSLQVDFRWKVLLYLLAVVRIVLCFLPQNRWTDRKPPVEWGIFRNIPFFLMGLMVAGRFFMCRMEIASMQWMWLAVLLSFAFYLPVVLFSNKNPKIGMLMLPKTCMYLWILAMFFTI